MLEDCERFEAAVIRKRVIIDLRYDTKDRAMNFFNYLGFKRF
jgi:hypothetical protein